MHCTLIIGDNGHVFVCLLGTWIDFSGAWLFLCLFFCWWISSFSHWYVKYHFNILKTSLFSIDFANVSPVCNLPFNFVCDQFNVQKFSSMLRVKFFIFFPLYYLHWLVGLEWYKYLSILLSFLYSYGYQFLRFLVCGERSVCCEADI